MLIPSKEYISKNFTASLSDDPSGIWYLDISCKSEKNGMAGKVVGHIPLCIQLLDNSDGSQDITLSVMDDEDEVKEREEGNDEKIINFKSGK